MLVEFAGVDVVDLDAVLDGLYACRVEAKVLAVYVVDALELVAVTDGPTQRGDLYLQFFLDFVQ